MIPGTKFSYRAETDEGIETNEVYITHDMKTILGVTCTVVDDHAQITAFAKRKSLAWTQGDLSPVYLSNVSSLTRGVLWIAPRRVLIIDRLVTESGEATMESLFHGFSIDNMSVHKGGFTIRSGKQELNAVVQSPTTSSLSLYPDVVKRSNITDNPIKPSGRIRLTTETRNGTAFSAVLMSSDLRLSGITCDDRGSVAITLEGGYILVNPGHGMLSNGPLGTDGILAAYMPDGSMLVVEGTHGSIDGNTIVHADIPVTVLVDGSHISFTAISTTKIHVSTEQRVRRVLLNGKEAQNWSRDRGTGMVSVTVQAGNGTIIFENGITFN